MIINEPKKFGLEILQFCGSGAYGEVYYCKDLSGKRIALKVIQKAKLGSEWQRELKGITNYRRITEDTTGLLKIYHVSEDEDVFYYTMEPADPVPDQSKYVPDTLSRRLSAGPLPSSQLIPFLSELLAGIANIHNAGFAHRDIKPENILFINGHPRLADLGLLSPMSISVTQLAGTLSYIPPEQLAGNSPYNDKESRQKNDLYAFGKIIYSCITGNAANYFPSVPENFSMEPANKHFFRLALRLCEKDPEIRLDKLSDVMAAFDKTVDKCLHGESAFSKLCGILGSCKLAMHSLFVHQWRVLRHNWIIVFLLLLILACVLWPYLRRPAEIDLPEDMLHPASIPQPQKEQLNVAEVPSLVVNTGLDRVDKYDGVTSLREALEYANLLAGKGEKPVITFAGNYEIVLKGESLHIRRDMTIDGGTSMPRLNGSNAASIFEIAPGVTLTLKNMIVTGGATEGKASIAVLADRRKICLYNAKASGTVKCNGWRGELLLYAGSSVENVEIYGMGALRTYANDCQLKNITVHGMHQRRGGDLEMNGGSAVNVRIQKFGDLYANGNSTIQELSLDEGAFAHLGHAGIVGMKTALGSLFVYEDKSILKGNIVLAGAAIGNGTGHSIIGDETSLMFDISSLTPSFAYSFPNIFLKHGLRQKTQTVKANAMLNKLDAFSGAGDYFINVSSKQEMGTYTLCEDANGFSGKMALLVGGQDTGEVFIVPEGIEGSAEIKYEGVTYALKKRNGVLELIVWKG